uniref:Uncharacterized protein n=1 Tax=Timema tahoe TaxID=61484 RepID=A0A7R9IHX3_9NEOP|nr:unnamed protein product [Timema tahoe]
MNGKTKPAAHSRSSGKFNLSKGSSKSGMKVLVDSIRSETPRPKSPHMNNEEPIELAHFPDAKRPGPGEKPKIERDDFPAPPYPYTDPERRRRWSDTYKGVPESDDENDQVDGAKNKEIDEVKKLKFFILGLTMEKSGSSSSSEFEEELENACPVLVANTVAHCGDTHAPDNGVMLFFSVQKEEEELSKIATGIGKVFLQNVREREKVRQWKLANMDPRNASRTPSASKEPTYRLRYESPVNASPSRNVDHPRPWEEEELLDHSSSYRSSVGRSVGTIPSYNGEDTSHFSLLL